MASSGQASEMLSEVEAGEIHRHEGEIEDASAVAKAVASARPDECYHLAAQTFVTGEELSTIRINVSGTLHVLDALRREAPECRSVSGGIERDVWGCRSISAGREHAVASTKRLWCQQSSGISSDACLS